jgi:hypothetical protein
VPSPVTATSDGVCQQRPLQRGKCSAAGSKRSVNRAKWHWSEGRPAPVTLNTIRLSTPRCGPPTRQPTAGRAPRLCRLIQPKPEGGLSKHSQPSRRLWSIRALGEQSLGSRPPCCGANTATPHRTPARSPQFTRRSSPAAVHPSQFTRRSSPVAVHPSQFTRRSSPTGFTRHLSHSTRHR